MPLLPLEAEAEVNGLAVRVLARIDAKPTLGAVKGVRYDGLRRVGPAAELAVEYEDQGADEIIVLDVTASLYGAPPAWEHLAAVAHALTIPLTYGGGIRSYAEAVRALRSGCEKIAINTAAVAEPTLLTECAKAFGAQAVVLNLEAKRAGAGWRAYTLGGREPTPRDAIAWAVEAVERGAGEILVTSVDRDGTQEGFDLELVAALAGRVGVPVVASGGCAGPADCRRILDLGASPAVGTWLHHGGRIQDIKRALADSGLEVRL